MVKEVRHFKTGDPEPTFPNDGKLYLLSMRFCPYAQRSHIILEAKKIPYHTFNINLTDKPEWLTKYSPLGKVPALGLPTEEGSPFIHESLIIADYLDEKYPEKRLYPEDPLAKAKDRLFIEQFNDVITAYYKVTKDCALDGLTDLSNGLAKFEIELKKRGTSFFGGNNPGMLDYMIWPWCERIALLKNLGFELDSVRFPKLIDWNTKMIADPAVNVHYLSAEYHSRYWETRKAGYSDYDMLFNKSIQ